MNLEVPSEGRADLGIGALELFVEVLSQSEAGVTVDGFYDHLCEAVCRLARMRRALIFRYDSADRRVRAVGAHGMDIEQFAGAHVTVESAPIAAQAIRQDRVVEVVGDLSGQVPEEFAALVSEPARLVCAPMAAAGPRVRRHPRRPPHGRAAARRRRPAAAVDAGQGGGARRRRRGSSPPSSRRPSQLEQRIDLARELHEGVIQRLFGVSMALDGDGELPASARRRCAEETQAALTDLRAALQRPLGRAPRATRTTLVAEVKRLAVAHPHLGLSLVEGTPGDVPPLLEPLAQSVLIEAVRNAGKHAEPTHVDVRLGRADGAFSLEVVNDGVTTAPAAGPAWACVWRRWRRCSANGVVEFGERGPGTWQVRLVVPDEDDD